MVLTSLHRFIDPANYFGDTVEEARQGSVADVASNLLIIRLGIELHAGNRSAAEHALQRLAAEHRQGYELFQVITAKVILAVESKQEDAVLSALGEWLEARKTAPGNWRNDALDAPELAPYIAKIDPKKLAAPILKKYTVTKADRAMVRDIDLAREQAVTENLEWLRQLGLTGAVKAIAKAYKIEHANHELREVTLGSSKKDWPDLIIALDKDGAVTSSFIAH